MRAGLFVMVIVFAIVFGMRLILLGQSAPAPASQTGAGTAAISGVVKNSATGRPIPGAIVELRFSSAAGLAPGLARTQRMLTDALGRFVFPNLPGVSGYTLTATRLGFVTGSYGQSTAAGPTGAINLTDGQWFDRADIVMSKPGAISGRVVDEHGDAVVGIYVRVLAQVMIAGTPRLVAGPAAKTDDRGEYRIAGLLPGRYLAMVPSVQSTVPADMPASALAPGGDSARGLELQLMGFGVSASPRVDAALDLDATNRLIVGNYAMAPAVNGRAQAYPITFSPGASTPASAASIQLGVGDEHHGADITLQPVGAFRVSGNVDGPRDLAAGTFLRLMPAGLEDLADGSEVATTVVDADGRFVFLNVPAGSYTIDNRRGATELTMDGSSTATGLPSAPGLVNRSSQSGNVKSGPPGTGFITRDGGVADESWTRTSISIAGDMSNVVVPLNRTITLNGRFVFDGATRSVVEKQQGGAAGVGPAQTTTVSGTTQRPFRLPVVYAEPASADASLGVPRSSANSDPSLTDAFVLNGLRGGEYVLRVNQGGGSYMVRSITMGGQDVTFRSIDTLTPRNAGDVVVTLTDRITTVNGFVQGDQTALANAAVIAFPVERDQWSKYGFTPTRLQATPIDAATGFRIRGLPAGDYYFVAVDRSLITAWQDPAFLARAAVSASRVKLDWGDERSVSLTFARIR